VSLAFLIKLIKGKPQHTNSKQKKLGNQPTSQPNHPEEREESRDKGAEW